MHIEMFNIFSRKEANFKRLTTDEDFTTYELTSKTQGELLTYLAIRESHDMVRVGIDAHNGLRDDI